MTTPLKGKALYTPKGKAHEYAPVACNFYTGCSNDCAYCYCKKGLLSAFWSNKPILKKCFKDQGHALSTFLTEMMKNLDRLRKEGVFFSFTTDPLLPETITLTCQALVLLNQENIPVTILSKSLNARSFGYLKIIADNLNLNKSLIAIGITLTGKDDLEPGAPSSADRIHFLKQVKNEGFRTIVSLEPIIDYHTTLMMFVRTLPFCDHYKIGLLSGKIPNLSDLYAFVELIIKNAQGISNIYFKDSITQYYDHVAGYSILNNDFDIFKPLPAGPTQDSILLDEPIFKKPVMNFP